MHNGWHRTEEPLTCPRYRVRTLDSEGREELERGARRRDLPAGKVVGAKIVLLSSQGYLPRDIARELGCNRRTAGSWVGRFDDHGMVGLEGLPRRGRPPVYSPEEAGTVTRTALTRPDGLGLPFGHWTLGGLVACLSEEKGVGRMGRSGMAQILSREGLRWRKQEGRLGERVDPEFAEERGPSSASTRPLQRTPSSSASTGWGR